MRKIALILSLTLLAVLLGACQSPAASTPAVTAAPGALPTPTLASPVQAATEILPAPTEPAPTQAATVVVAGQPVDILTTRMLDANTGWATGVLRGAALQRLLRTGDGGSTWTDVTPADMRANAGATSTAALFVAPNAQNAWVLYYSPTPAPSSDPVFVWRTTDAGQTWTAGDPVPVEDLTMDFFLPADLGFSDEQNGWLLAHLGAGMSHDYVAVYRTADGGQTWQRTVDPSQETLLTNGLPMTCAKTGLTFIDAQHGFASGNCNGVVPGIFLYKTEDGGTLWEPVNLPDPVGQAGLIAGEQNACGTQPPVFVDAQQAYLPVVCQTANGTQRFLYQSSDGGLTWQGNPEPLPYGATEFTGAGQGFFLGYADDGNPQMKTLFSTSNGGEDWFKVAEKYSWNATIDFVDGKNGWAVVKEESGTLLMRTTNGGRTWTEVRALLIP